MTAFDLYRTLRRRKLLIAVLTAICTVLTFFLSLAQTPLYEAETLVRIQQRINQPDAFQSLEASQSLAKTYAEIIRTGALRDRVEREARRQDPGIVVTRDDLSARPVRDLDLLTMAARSPNPRRAALVANAVPRALQSFIQGTGTRGDSIVTVARARVPPSPTSPKLLLNIVLALLLGLIVNSAIALLVDVLADRLPDPDRLEEVIGVPVLATVPTLEFPRPTRAVESRERLRERSERPRSGAASTAATPEGPRVG